MLILSACKKDDENEAPEKIYPYDLINPTFAELQSFYEDGYNVIDGNVELDNIDSLFNMLTFSNLRKITGHFRIENNYELASFDGLNNLKTIGDSFIIFNNRGDLPNLEGLNNLQSISDGFIISSNSRLKSLEGIYSLKSINGFIIEGNHDLINLDGLYELHHVVNLLVSNNNELNNLEGLNNIQSISNKLSLYDNKNLLNFCSIRILLANNGVGGEISINNNLFNPSVGDIIAGNCSQ